LTTPQVALVTRHAFGRVEVQQEAGDLRARRVLVVQRELGGDGVVGQHLAEVAGLA
jgi:hypothetical protein